MRNRRPAACQRTRGGANIAEPQQAGTLFPSKRQPADHPPTCLLACPPHAQPHFYTQPDAGPRASPRASPRAKQMTACPRLNAVSKTRSTMRGHPNYLLKQPLPCRGRNSLLNSSVRQNNICQSNVCQSSICQSSICHPSICESSICESSICHSII